MYLYNKYFKHYCKIILIELITRSVVNSDINACKGLNIYLYAL